MNNFIDNYNSRQYVLYIKWGHKLFGAGLLIMIALAAITFGSPISELIAAIACLIAFIAGIIHHFDSRARIRRLKLKLNRNG